MEVTATVRVRGETADGRPSRESLQIAADYLRERGFNVLHLGLFGVLVRALPQIFADEFSIRLDQERVAAVRVTPRRAALAPLIDTIEVAPPAKLLHSAISA